MKIQKILAFAGLFLALAGFSSTAFADEPDITSYTLIDCYNGDDATATPFVPSKPYHTLKAGIENSINYVHSHSDWMVPQGRIIEIRVKSKCVFDSYNQSVTLNYTPTSPEEASGGLAIANTLLIRPTEPGVPYGIRNTYFTDEGLTAWGITFYNADFLSWSAAFWGSLFKMSSPRGIKIKNSAITTSGNISPIWRCINGNWYWGNWYCNVYNFSNIGIENSYIKVVGNWGDTNFAVPGYVKNSKIEYSIPAGQSGRLVINGSNSAYNLLQSDIINVNGQDLRVEVDSLNSKFDNVRGFSAVEGWQVFANNTLGTSQPYATSSAWNYSYNNAFMGGYSDPQGDSDNTHRNSNSEQTTGGVGWKYKRAIGGYIETNINDRMIYSETHNWEAAPENFSPIFVTF